MPGFYQITYLPEGRTEQFSGSRGNYYRLDNGSQIKLHSEPVWCDTCQKVTHGETLEPIKQIDKQIEDLERLAAEIRRDMTRPPLPAPDAPGDRYQREQIAELQLRREWRKLRRWPPRCIYCGSTNITQLEHLKPTRVGRNTIVLQVIGMSSTHFNMWHFTPEGKRITES